MTESPIGVAGPASPASTALACLVVVGRMHGLRLDADRLAIDGASTAGEPDFATLAACAERAGFRCKALSLDWGRLGDLKRALPAIVRLRDGRSAVLARIEEHADGSQVVLYDPAEDPDAPVVWLRAAFDMAWTGEILLLKKTMAAVDADRPFGWGTIGALVRGQGRLLRDLVGSTAALAVLALAPILFAEALVGDVLNLQAPNTFLFLGCCIVLLVLFEGAFAAVRQGLVTRLSTQVALQLDTLMFGRLLRLPIGFFETTPIGLVAHRMAGAQAIPAMLSGPLTQTALDAGILLVFIPAMLFTSLILTGIVGALLALAAMLVLLSNGRYLRATGALGEAEGEASVFLTETLGGFATVKSLALEGRQRRRWDVSTARVTRLRLAVADAATTLDTIGRVFDRLVVFGPFALGAAFTITGFHAVSAAQLFGFLLMSWRVAAPLRDLPGVLRCWNEGRDAIASVASLVDEAPEVARGRAGAHVPLKGEISFGAVHFTYPDTPAPALQSLTFTVPAGTTLGIMGRSGAGKTTIARLLQRLHADYQGLIKIDGIDVREFDIDHLRAGLAVVSQDSPLFAGTIRDNLCAAQPDASDDAVLHAIRLVGAEEFIDRLPHGDRTVLGEGAPSLSDGQRQRIAIARALLADPAILVLDEATSALDPESEALLTGNLRRLAGERTIIVISQRLAALAQADAILVLDRGEVQDIGRHQDLIERSDLYSGLWRRQTGRLDRPPAFDNRLSRGSHVA